MILAAAQGDELPIEEGSPELQLSPSGKIITEQHVLEASGDRRLESVRQLVMRGMQLISFDPACMSRLRNLAVSSKRLRHASPLLYSTASSFFIYTNLYKTRKPFSLILLKVRTLLFKHRLMLFMLSF